MAETFSSIVNALKPKHLVKYFVKNALDFMFHNPKTHLKFHQWFISAGDSEPLSAYIPRHLYKHYLNRLLGCGSKQMFDPVVS